jgi:hypothetical protein
MWLRKNFSESYKNPLKNSTKTYTDFESQKTYQLSNNLYAWREWTDEEKNIVHET